MLLYQRVSSFMRMDIDGKSFTQNNSRGISRCDYLKGAFWRSERTGMRAWPGNILEKYN
jgi:hypothetical protein